MVFLKKNAFNTVMMQSQIGQKTIVVRGLNFGELIQAQAII